MITSRPELLDTIAKSEYDLCIIGGGATGLGCALDAQLRGLRTVLIEARDFASATSSASTKLAHGGVRYLQQAVQHLDAREYRLVKDGLRERALMLRNAPHLAHPLEFVVPCYSRFDLLYYGIGLKMYDWMAGSRRLVPSRIISKRAAVERVPRVRADHLSGAVTYADGQFDDARYAIALLTAFRDAGGDAVNYVRAVGFEKNASGRIQALNVDADISIRARAFINATGPFSDAVRRMASPTALDRIEPSKGIHVLFPLDGWRNDALLVPRTDDGRVVFAIPYLGRLLIGTTDDAAPPDPDPLVTRAEVDYLLAQANRYLAKPLAAEEIVSAFAGIRPLIAHSTSETKRLVRDDEVEVDTRSGLISILGGKWTTYRLMAERTIDCAQQQLGIAVGGCRTHDHRLPKPASAETLEARVTRAVRGEMALTIEDVLRRRLGIELFSWSDARDAAPAAGEIMAAELGWSHEETDRAIQQYVARIGRMREAVGLTVKGRS